MKNGKFIGGVILSRCLEVALCTLVGIIIISANAHADVYFGREHTALGAAQLSSIPQGLEVSNIGSSGNDGVLIDLPSHTEPFLVDLIDPGNPLAFPAGAYFEISAIGTINGVSAQKVSTVKHTYSNGVMTTSIDLLALSPTSLTANYYFEDMLVLTETGIDPLSALSSTEAGWSFNDISISFWPPGVEISWCKSGGSDLTTLQGSNIIVDEMIVIAVDNSNTLDAYSGLSITGSDVDSFTITSEVIPEPSTFALIGLAGGGVLFIRRYRLY